MYVMTATMPIAGTGVTSNRTWVTHREYSFQIGGGRFKASSGARCIYQLFILSIIEFIVFGQTADGGGR